MALDMQCFYCMPSTLSNHRASYEYYVRFFFLVNTLKCCMSLRYNEIKLKTYVHICIYYMQSTVQDDRVKNTK